MYHKVRYNDPDSQSVQDRVMDKLPEYPELLPLSEVSVPVLHIYQRYR